MGRPKGSKLDPAHKRKIQAKQQANRASQRERNRAHFVRALYSNAAAETLENQENDVDIRSIHF